MWSKGDRTECRTNITELEYHRQDNNAHTTTITVATKNADDIMNLLNEYEILKTILNRHYKELQEMHKHPETFKDVMMSNLFMTYLHDLQKIFKKTIQELKERE